MKNNKEVMEDFRKKVEKLFNSEDFKKYLDDIIKEEKEGLAFVGNINYFNWLTEIFLQKLDNKTYDNEDFLYTDKKDFTETDIKNEEKIVYVGDFLETVRKEQRAQKDEDYSFPFEGVKYCFKFNKKLYVYFFTVGQGTSIVIREADSDEIFTRNINLDKYFENK